MAVAKRNIREVVDPLYDLINLEFVNYSWMTGWTTNASTIAPGAYGGALYILYAIDAFGNQPHQDGVNVTFDGSGNLLADSFIYINNTGLKHLHQQMQAMKNNNGTTALADDFNSSSPSNTGITDVGNNGGLYKNWNISMGNMRGFEYHVANEGHYPSTTGTAERLINTGEISVGSTS